MAFKSINMVYAHTISLTPHVSIEVPVRRQESGRSGICNPPLNLN
jgi:hypothetical protein